MQISPYYGVRNVAVYIVEVRKKLGLSRKALSKYLGLREKAVIEIEQGKLPPLVVLDRLKLLHRISSSVLFIVSLIMAIYSEIQFGFMIATNMVTSEGQLLLPCCAYLFA